MSSWSEEHFKTVCPEFTRAFQNSEDIVTVQWHSERTLGIFLSGLLSSTVTFGQVLINESLLKSMSKSTYKYL